MAKMLTYKSHARALLVLGLPLIGSHLAQLAIGITDNVMAGWYSVEALAAITLGHSINFVLFIVGSGFAFAILPMVANASARGEHTQLRRVTRMGMWISILFGAVGMPILIWSDPILRALGQQPEIASLTADYLQILAIGLIPALLVMVLKNHLAGLEKTRAILWITIVAAVLNGVLNYALIFGKLGAPELGVKGAAAASVTMQIASLIMTIIYLNRTFPEQAMFQRFWRPDFDAFRRVFRLGWPIGLTNLAESGLFSASAILMGWIGALPLAAHGIAIQLASITFVVHLGLSQAATVRVGQANGKGDLPGMFEGAKVATGLSIIFAFMTIVVFLTIPEIMIAPFLDPTDPDRPQILIIGASLLAVAALFQLVDGAQVIALGLLRGLEDTRTPMIYAALSYWGIGIPASYILGFSMGWEGVGIWLGLVIGLAIAAVLLMQRFWRRVSREMKA